MEKEGCITEIVCPGIVVLRNILTLSEQCHFIEIVQRHGGLKDASGKWNFFEKRGRTFDSLGNYPPEDEAFIRHVFERMRFAIEGCNSEIPIADCTHILTWWYPDQKGIGWHKDGYGGNDGDKDSPVYSLTLGNTCIFEWRPTDGSKERKDVNLASGDAIVFGGPRRMIMHRVKKIICGSFKHPDDDAFDARINITFRKLEGFTKEDEHAFQTDVYQERIKKNKNV